LGRAATIGVVAVVIPVTVLLLACLGLCLFRRRKRATAIMQVGDVRSDDELGPAHTVAGSEGGAASISPGDANLGAVQMVFVRTPSASKIEAASERDDSTAVHFRVTDAKAHPEAFLGNSEEGAGETTPSE